MDIKKNTCTYCVLVCGSSEPHSFVKAEQIAAAAL